MNQHGLKGKLSDVYLNILTWLFSNILQVYRYVVVFMHASALNENECPFHLLHLVVVAELLLPALAALLTLS